MRRTLPTVLLLLGATGALGACSDGADPLAPRPAGLAPAAAERTPSVQPGNAAVSDIDDALERLVPALGPGADAGRLRATLQQLRAAVLAGDASGAKRHLRDAEQHVAALEDALGSDAAADLGAIALLLDARR
jgi:hypothetical protein